MRLPAGGAVTGWASLRLHGAGLLDGVDRDGVTPLPVPLALGARGRARRSPEVLLSNEPLEPHEIVRRAGVPVTTVERAVFDGMRQAPDEREATVILEMAFAAKLTSLPRVRRYVDAHPGVRKVAQARWAAAMATKYSWSPYETRLRLLWILDAHLPRPVVNCPIHRRGGPLVGTVDLLHPTAALVAEFDGEDHRRKSRHVHDVRKEDALRRLHLEVTRVTATDMGNPRLVVERLWAALERAPVETEADRQWEIRPACQTLEEELCERDTLASMREELWSQPVRPIQEPRAW